jgi:hypothetical protein
MLLQAGRTLKDLKFFFFYISFVALHALQAFANFKKYCLFTDFFFQIFDEVIKSFSGSRQVLQL